MNCNRVNKRGLVKGKGENIVISQGQQREFQSENNTSFGNQLPVQTSQTQFSGNNSDHSRLHQQGEHRYIRQVSGPLNTNMGVNLRFSNDLITMTQNWTREEFESSRRLVKFEFHDSENAIQTISFQPVASSTCSENPGPIISCIFWKEKDRHIATSVDIIVILEYLVHQNFGIEEKNRIRRNLQSLKPTTVSRSNKEDCEFFNLIMSMENPRPRNIEKDLKVFNWGDLGKAIAKVMSKYSVISPKGNVPIYGHINSGYGNLFMPNSPSLIDNDNLYGTERNSMRMQNPYESQRRQHIPFQIPPQPPSMYSSIVTEHYTPIIPHQYQVRIPPPGLQPLLQPIALPPNLLQPRPQVDPESAATRINKQFISTPMRSSYFSTNGHVISDNLNNEEYRISLGIGNDSNSSVSSCNTEFSPEELNKQQQENSSTDTSVYEKQSERSNKLPSISQILNSDIKVNCLSLPPIETGERLPSVSKLENWKTS